jgi:hypothetical protein
MTVRRFPNVPRLLASLLTTAAIVPAGRVGTETPATLDTQLPFIRVRRVGGNSDQVNDYPTVDVDVFHSTAVNGESLAELVRQYLTTPGLPAVPLRGVIDRVECMTGPQELPWADTRVRRFGATYRITCRRYTSVA